MFNSKYLSRFCYPLLIFTRRVLLFIKDVFFTPPISQKPFIEMIFDKKAAKVPRILQKRYSLIPYSTNYLLLTGTINISISKIFNIFAPLFKFIGSLPFYPEKNIPVTVELISEQASDKILMNRTFHYHQKPAYHFNSKIIHIKDNVVLELMQFGMAAKLIYRLEANKIIMDYGGYFLQVGRWRMPLPLGWVIGKFSACETAIDDAKFSMVVSLQHPVFGKIYQYDGIFTIEEDNRPLA
ncbi:DUF4166 domain-containing protein [Candidatus Tisiphia endosymbiont of Beris chalybata]|uniref:DUF4166 domain-containing protein n=1 Tax=Candidatus Tisiphia endosymbiont of Beris chalybata TaxID=3066262 RepID=UPI00312CA247